MDVKTFDCTLRLYVNTFCNNFTFICYWYDLGRNKVVGFIIVAKTPHLVVHRPFQSCKIKYRQLCVPSECTYNEVLNRLLEDKKVCRWNEKNTTGLKKFRGTITVSFQPKNCNNEALLRNVRVRVMDSGCFRHSYSTGFYLKCESQQWENHSHAEFITAVVTQNHG